MKRWFPWIMFAAVALLVASSWLRPARPDSRFDLVKFGKLPVLVGGRVQPMDSVARNSLLIISGKQRLRLKGGERIPAIQWLAELLFDPDVADSYPTFLITNPEVLGLFGMQQEADRKHYSFSEIATFLQTIDEQAAKAEAIESSARSPYQTAILNLRNAVMIYQRLKNSLQPANTEDFAAELALFERSVPSGMEALQLRQAGQPHNEEALAQFAAMVQRYRAFGQLAYILPGPPEQGNHWMSLGDCILQVIATRTADPLSRTYAALGDAYRANDPAVFSSEVSKLQAWLAKHRPQETERADFETLFNRLQPFYESMILYLVAFLLACISWLAWPRTFSNAASLVLVLALAIHTFGLVSRMVLQGRPPVTNLYSSAIFIGWGTVLLGLVMERIFRDGLSAACASIIGFVTLIIAQHLAESGDTMEMLRAVLDTNIWLATHVVVITLGYSAMFFAGVLAILYIVRGVFTKSLDTATARNLTRMTYGVICFATLFSFVGTVLGGIWADQSWGRFWGWDPKENGALLIVLWCAIVLHSRWGGYIRQRGLMVMAVFGNIVTSFSWFGVNMLGVGLHSYGFMDKAFPWLAAFMASQLLIMAVGGLPLAMWRSFATDRTPMPHGNTEAA